MTISIPPALRGLFFSVSTLVIFVVLYLVINALLLSTANDARAYQNEISQITQNGQFLSTTEDYANTLRALNAPIKSGDKTLPFLSLEQFVAPRASNLQEVIGLFEAGQPAEARQAFASTNELINETVSRKAQLIFTLQIVVAIMVVIFYCVVIFQMFRRAGTVESTTKQARKESEGIMNTISEGLFLMKSDFEIGIEQSASLKEMFRSERDIEGNFFDFVREYVTPNTLQIAKDYIELLFGERVKEKLITDLNPLNEVEINILRRDGSYEHRYLNFGFKRVMEDGRLSHLLCSVTDVTREIELAKQLEEAQVEQEAQLDLLMSVLHVDPKQLAHFFTMADQVLNEMNTTLEQSSAIHEKEKHSDRSIRSKLNDIAALAHKLKGDAAILELNKFEFGTHDLETELKTLQESREPLDGKSLLPLVTKLRDLFSELENMRGLVEKFATVVNSQALAESTINAPSEFAATQVIGSGDPTVSVGTDIGSGAATEEDLSLAGFDDDVLGDTSMTATNTASFEQQLQQLVNVVAERQGKNVSLNCKIGEVDLLNDSGEAIKDITVQLVRNCVVHGIETPEVRAAREKPEQGAVTVSLQKTSGNYSLAVQDDGAGLDIDKITEQARNKGLIAAGREIDERLAMNLIFKPGFSSKENADLDGGRGVGLDLVMREVKKLGGKIGMKQEPTKQCKFTVKIPA